MMKTLRILGAVFVVLGIIFSLTGILASLFPLIQNEHFKLILNSFQETSTDSLTNTLNSIVRFCLHSNYFLLFTGIALMVIGGLVSSAAHKRYPTAAKASAAAPAARPAAIIPGIPKPAYYPGGLAPPVFPREAEQPDLLFLTNDLKPPYSVRSGQKQPPISGGVEPSFAAEEFDAQKLLQRDQRLSSARHTDEPTSPNNQFLSNNAARPKPEPQIAKPSPQSARAAAAEKPPRPKIISTVGKQRF